MKKIFIALSILVLLFTFFTSHDSFLVQAAASGGWHSTSLVNAPAARQGHTAIWTGKEMIIWGGQSSGGYPIVGVRYNPVTDTWQPISTVNAPLGREQHTAIWTGKEMIIWGGNGGGNNNIGAKYNPDADTWTTMSAVNAPSARVLHSAVWTGTEMIVWGGVEIATDKLLNDGAKYNPDIDAWTPISLIGAPDERRMHRAVWTGTEMIVWGGQVHPSSNDWHYANTGGRYDPDTNTWKSTSITNAPPGMPVYGLVWTGLKMIVPGYSGTNISRLYDPSSDIWQVASTNGAPTPADAFSVVWTGQEMIFWGGTHAPETNEGSRYNPQTNSWEKTTLINAPLPRAYHTVVWTGSEMIIWGGNNVSNNLNSGGKYYIPPCTIDNWECGNWNNCPASGTQSRTCNKVSGCVGGTPSPSSTQPCVYTPPMCSSWAYSDWSVCSTNGQQTRTVAGSSPNGCAGGNPILSQNCTYIPPCTVSSWQCSDWNGCSVDGKQARSCDKVSVCKGGVISPATSQTCTYVAPTCTSWTYSNWSSCSPAGQQTRNILSSIPVGCTDGNPVLQQSCTPPCSTDTWSCGDWNACPTSGTQTRSCTKNFDCPTTETPSPITSQNCTPPQPICNADTWTCGGWDTCSLSGIQNRSCTKTFDCQSAETAPPTISQYCESPNRPQQAPPTDSGEVKNQDIIIRATVKLMCPFDGRGWSQGSGTVIDPSGIVLTNKHVVSGTLGCLVGFINDFNDEPYFGERQIADIIKVTPNADIAILKIRNPQNQKLTYIDIKAGNSSNLHLGDRISIYGYPGAFGANITYTSGDFSGTRTDSYLKTTAILEHGNSGGGAYLKSGTFLGIPSEVTVKVKDTVNVLGYILPVNVINAWLGNSRIVYNSQSNNNYSRVSSILENIDLKKLGSVKILIPDTDANGNRVAPVEILKVPKVIEQPKVDQKTPKVVEKVQPSKPQEESTVIELADAGKDTNPSQQNQVELKNEQPKKISWVKRLFSWLASLLK